MSAEHVPTRRRIVGLYVLLAVVLVIGIAGMAEQLRHDLPAPDPVEVVAAPTLDPLRQDVECPVGEGREGQGRPETPTGPALPEALSSSQLLDCPATWDGRRVLIRGEVVGPPLNRRGDAWLQVNDDAYALDLGPLPTHRDMRGGNGGVGVLMTPGQAGMVGLTGRTGVRGDIVEVTGIFNRVHPTSGEVAIVVADDVTVVRRGYAFDAPPSGPRPFVASFAALVALAIWVIERRIRARR